MASLGPLKLVLICLVLSGVQGDDQEIDCEKLLNETHEAKLTHMYCQLEDVMERFRSENGGWLLFAVGWCFTALYHATRVLKAYAEKREEDERTPEGGGDYKEVREFLMSEYLPGYMSFARQLGWICLVHSCYFGTPSVTPPWFCAIVSCTAVLLYASQVLSCKKEDYVPWCVTLILMLFIGVWAFNAGEWFEANPFCYSIFIVFFDLTATWFTVGIIIQRFVYRGSIQDAFSNRLPKLGVRCFADLRKKIDQTIITEPSTIYFLPKVSVARRWMTWTAQVSLGALYVIVMNQQSHAIKRDSKVLMWLLGAIVVCICGEQEAGDPFNSMAWTRVLREDTSASEKHLCRWLCVRARWFQDWTTNSLLRQMLLSTVPILLSTEGPIDFIKDVLAIFFVARLDDPSDDQKERFQKMFDESDDMDTAARKVLKAIQRRDVDTPENTPLLCCFNPSAFFSFAESLISDAFRPRCAAALARTVHGSEYVVMTA